MKVELYQGDCRELLAKVPDGSIDLILTDPPYNISQKAVIQRNGGKFGVSKDIDLDFGEWDHHSIDPHEWIPLAVNKLKPEGVFATFYDRRYISDIAYLLETEGLTIRHIAGWHKQNPAPQARKVKWMNALELFVIATMNAGAGHHYNFKEGQQHDCIETPICLGNERLKGEDGQTLHPTQKPLALLKPIIRWWSFPDDIVLDPFMGVGSTGVAAIELFRSFVGIEKDERFFKAAKARVDGVARQYNGQLKMDKFNGGG